MFERKVKVNRNCKINLNAKPSVLNPENKLYIFVFM